MADIPVIELRGVGKTYYNADVATPVLFDMSFQVGRGEFVAIVGGSGSGGQPRARSWSTDEMPARLTNWGARASGATDSVSSSSSTTCCPNSPSSRTR
jgi:ABC-type phosphonate transport system ATPase subunit